MKTVRILYSGRVQGVGFRATAVKIAKKFQVKGTVKNTPDGRVELMAQGDEKEVSKFLEAITAYWKDHIEAADQNEELTQNFSAFKIMP